MVHIHCGSESIDHPAVFGFLKIHHGLDAADIVRMEAFEVAHDHIHHIEDLDLEMIQFSVEIIDQVKQRVFGKEGNPAGRGSGGATWVSEFHHPLPRKGPTG